jgi:hypothetical protein
MFAFVLNLLLAATIVVLFMIKSVVEESFLRGDPEYIAYLQRVHCPLVFPASHNSNNSGLTKRAIGALMLGLQQNFFLKFNHLNRETNLDAPVSHEADSE